MDAAPTDATRREPSVINVQKDAYSSGRDASRNVLH